MYDSNYIPSLFFSYVCLYSLEGRVGILTQQSHSQQENITEEDENVDTIINKFYAISQLIAPSWLITLAWGKTTNTDSNDNTPLTTVPKQYEDAPIQKFKLLNSAMIDVIVHCVILFKQSPLPGMYI